jgi:AcrR family transcriptional regulator
MGMPKLTESAQKELIIRRLFQGLSYDKIAQEAGVSDGTVTNYLGHLKRGDWPEYVELADIIEELRKIAVECKRNNVQPTDLIAGSNLLKRLLALDVEPVWLDNAMRCWKKLLDPSIDQKKYLEAAINLHCLEEERGVPYDKICETYEDMEKNLEKGHKTLNKVLEETKDTKSNLTRLKQKEKETSETLVQLMQPLKQLEKEGINVKDFDKLVTIIFILKKKKFDIKRLQPSLYLDKELYKIGLDGDQGLGFLKNLNKMARMGFDIPAITVLANALDKDSKGLPDNRIQFLKNLKDYGGIYPAHEKKVIELNRLNEDLRTLEAKIALTNDRIVKLNKIEMDIQDKIKNLNAEWEENERIVKEKQDAQAKIHQQAIAELVAKEKSLMATIEQLRLQKKKLDLDIVESQDKLKNTEEKYKDIIAWNTFFWSGVWPPYPSPIYSDMEKLLRIKSGKAPHLHTFEIGAEENIRKKLVGLLKSKLDEDIIPRSEYDALKTEYDKTKASLSHVSEEHKKAMEGLNGARDHINIIEIKMKMMVPKEEYDRMNDKKRLAEMKVIQTENALIEQTNIFRAFQKGIIIYSFDCKSCKNKIQGNSPRLSEFQETVDKKKNFIITCPKCNFNNELPPKEVAERVGLTVLPP